MLLAVLLIALIGGVIATQINQLASDLPRYQSTMREKIKSVRGTTLAGSTLERAADVLQDLGKELDKPRDGHSLTPPSAAPASGQEARPIPVEVRQPPPTALQNLAALISPLLHPLTTSGITIIFVVFILLKREDLRNRLIKLLGSHDLQKTTAALDDGARRLSRLFLTQLALNSAFGVVIGTGLWFIGVPSPALWGILAAVLRFVPYIGAFIAALLPLVLAASVDPDWSMLLQTAALFLIVEPIVGHVIEPLVIGRSTGLSPVAVVVSATFWAALWGPIGLLLATPLTICVVVLGRHVEGLHFLDVMFGDRPALSPSEIFYQRMLAGDPPEAVDQAEEFLKEKPLSAYYDEVALKGLVLGQNDIFQGSLDESRIEKMKESVGELLEELGEQPDRTPVSEPTQDVEAVAAIESTGNTTSEDLPFLENEELAPAWQGSTPVLCAAARSPLDDLAVLMLAQLLGKHGLGARVESAEMFSGTRIVELKPADVAMVALSYLDSSSPAHMRLMIRRVRRKFPEAEILVGCWLEDADKAPSPDAVKADHVVTTLSDAVKVCVESAGRRSKRSTIRTKSSDWIAHEVTS